MPKTWYGMPAYANEDGKIVVSFQGAGTFGYRHWTLGFQDIAHLDDGDSWPASFALARWSPPVEKKVVELVKAAVSRSPGRRTSGPRRQRRDVDRPSRALRRPGVAP